MLSAAFGLFDMLSAAFLKRQYRLLIHDKDLQLEVFFIWYAASGAGYATSGISYAFSGIVYAFNGKLCGQRQFR
ncbi:hypothetical protein [Klebsiella michiganensis]|uniref:hypothetical protein n=1 Tax=Klebsiella michiganensis TaxID=1134687 RepID=UPI003F4FD715